jgi:diguanylate cyclase (GGDEF)-like protein
MADIDFFKRINDTHGHAIGDEAIQSVADCLRGVVRESDMAGRIGGEEFAIILPETNASEAYLLAERIREEVGRIIVNSEGNDVTFTVSLGVAQCNGDSNTLDKVMAKADHALYAAKESGRNKTSY